MLGLDINQPLPPGGYETGDIIARTIAVCFRYLVDFLCQVLLSSCSERVTLTPQSPYLTYIANDPVSRVSRRHVKLNRPFRAVVDE